MPTPIGHKWAVGADPDSQVIANGSYDLFDDRDAALTFVGEQLDNDPTTPVTIVSVDPQ